MVPIRRIFRFLYVRSADPRRASPVIWQRWVFFLLVLILIAGSAKPHISGFDSETRFWFLHHAMTGQDTTPPHSRKYSSSMAWAGLPMYALGWATIGGRTGDEAIKHLKATVANTNHLLLFGFCIWLFFWMRRRLGFSDRDAALGVLGVLLASMAIPDSEDFYSETLSSIAVFYLLDQAACAFVPGPGCAYRPHKLVLGIAASIWFNPVFAPVIVIAVAVTFLLTERDALKRLFAPHASRSSTMARVRALIRPEVLWAAVGVLLGVCIYGVENYLKFGSIWITGYEGEHNFTYEAVNYLNILVALGKGVLWYAPGLAVALVALWSIRTDKRIGPSLRAWITIWYGFFVGMVAVYGSTFNWGAFRYWGPRYMLSVTIFVATLLILLIRQRRLLLAAARWSVYAAFAYGVLVNWIGETVGQHYYDECASQTEACSTAWSTSPLYIFSKPVSDWLMMVEHRYAASALLVGIGMLFLYRWLSPQSDRPGAAST